MVGPVLRRIARHARNRQQRAAESLLHRLNSPPGARRIKLRAGGAERRNGRHPLRPGAHRALLRAAEAAPPDRHAPTDIQRAAALERMDLVPANSDEIRPQRRRIDFIFAQRLHRVDVKQRRGAHFTDARRHDLHRRQRAGFVIDHHDRDEDRVRRDGLPQRFGVDRPIRLRLYAHHLEPARFQLPG